MIRSAPRAKVLVYRRSSVVSFGTGAAAAKPRCKLERKQPQTRNQIFNFWGCPKSLKISSPRSSLSSMVMAMIGPERARFSMLAMYCLLSCMNSAMWNTFAPISDDSEVYFGVSATWINFLAVVWSVIYGPGTVLGIYWFQKYELRSTLLLCASITVIGSALRFLAVILRDSWGSVACYSLVLLGQILIGIGQPIVCNLATGMASIWFPVEERDRATTIGTVFNPLGNAIGSILPPLIVYSTSTNTDDSTYVDIKGMELLMLVQFLMSLLALLLIALFFRAKPKNAPSYSEANRNTAREALKSTATNVDVSKVDMQDNSLSFSHSHASQDSIDRGERRSRASRASCSGRLSVDATAINLQLHAAEERSLLWSELMELSRNREYLLLVASFSIGLGLVNAVLTLVFQLVGPVGYTNADAGWFSFILIMVGMVCSGAMAVALEKTRAYRNIYTYGFIICWASIIFFCFMLYPDNYPLLCVAFGLMGSTIIPLFPACLENTAECTYPVSEDISVGMLLTAGNFGTIAITVGLQAMIEASSFSSKALPWNLCNISCVGVLSIATIFALMYKGDSKRLRADHMGQGQGSSVDKNSSGNPLFTSDGDGLSKPLLQE